MLKTPGLKKNTICKQEFETYLSILAAENVDEEPVKKLWLKRFLLNLILGIFILLVESWERRIITPDCFFLAAHTDIE